MTINIERMSHQRFAKLMRRTGGLKVFADGRQIHSVFYADVRRGVIRTRDVRDDGTLAWAVVGCPFPIDPSWSTRGDVLSKTIYAKRIELIPMDPA